MNEVWGQLGPFVWLSTYHLLWQAEGAKGEHGQTVGKYLWYGYVVLPRERHANPGAKRLPRLSCDGVLLPYRMSDLQRMHLAMKRMSDYRQWANKRYSMPA